MFVQHQTRVYILGIETIITGRAARCVEQTCRLRFRSNRCAALPESESYERSTAANRTKSRREIESILSAGSTVVFCALSSMCRLSCSSMRRRCPRCCFFWADILAHTARMRFSCSCLVRLRAALAFGTGDIAALVKRAGAGSGWSSSSIGDRRRRRKIPVEPLARDETWSTSLTGSILQESIDFQPKIAFIGTASRHAHIRVGMMADLQATRAMQEQLSEKANGATDQRGNRVPQRPSE